MKLNANKLVVLIALTCFLSLPALADQVLWDQPFDQTGNAYSSQNDTNGMGNFATVYDNFKLQGSATITSFRWVGAYFNPPQQGQITGWTLAIYNDDNGQPGSSLLSKHYSGNGNETFVGNFGGFPVYNYDVDDPWPINCLPCGTYWMSFVPDVGFPPQWGWAGGTGGDGISYQDFFGVRSQLAADMAFQLDGHFDNQVPEPGTLIMVGIGVLGVGTHLRRRFLP
jgi:hypothetical protein